jgi:hypothetical protein
LVTFDEGTQIAAGQTNGGIILEEQERRVKLGSGCCLGSVYLVECPEDSMHFDALFESQIMQAAVAGEKNGSCMSLGQHKTEAVVDGKSREVSRDRLGTGYPFPR